MGPRPALGMVDFAAIDWDLDGAPRSRRFDDLYFSRAGGLAEARTVFLQGCGLPQGWRGRDRFVVGELGFGSGLNVLALLELWRASREPGARLHVFSVEAFPLRRDDAARVLAGQGGLADLALPLLRAWPATPGFHRIDYPGLDAVVDLALMEAGEALEAWTGRADAWFLDGFAPAKNPAMWREPLLALVAARSAPGARLATYTVAGEVRRRLQALGFAVERRPGFGGKRQRLEARLGDAPPTPSPRGGRVCVVGAGVAGAALSRALVAEGLAPLVIDRGDPATGASGNAAALVTPRLDASGGPVARLHAQGFARARALIERDAPDSIIARGALQLEAQPRDARRFDAVCDGGLFDPAAMQRLDPAGAAARLGEPLQAGGLWIAEALVVEPRVLIDRWLGGAELLREEVEVLQFDGGTWRLLGPGGRVLVEAEAVVLAAGWAARGLLPGLPLRPVRGQVSLAARLEPVTAAAWGGYLIPTREGVLFGATHDRDDADAEPRAVDHARNLELLSRMRPALAHALGGARLEGRAGVRAATPDHCPLAGPCDARGGLHVLGGLGGRGFNLAPLLAEHVVSAIAGAPSPAPRELQALVGPDRFSGGSAGPSERVGSQMVG